MSTVLFLRNSRIRIPYQLMSIMESMGQFKHLYSTMHRKFNNSMLERARRKQSRKRKSTEGGATDRSKRTPNLVNTHSIFCGGTTSEPLHVFITFR